MFISDWIDIEVSMGNNFNHQGTDRVYIHFQNDRTTTNGTRIGTGVAININDNYLHATHQYSITFGDPVTSGGSYEQCNVGKQKTSGTVSTLDARVKFIGKTGGTLANLQNSEMDVDFGLDLRGVQCLRNNKFRVADAAHGAFYCDEAIEGELEIDSDTPRTITTADAANNLTIKFTDLGLVSYPPRQSKTLSSGSITIDRKQVFVNAETGTADDLETILIKNSVTVNGEIIGVRAAAGDTITVVNTGNIRLPSTGTITLTTTQYTYFQYDKNDDKWIWVGGES
jgi:hypothetical protein